MDSPRRWFSQGIDLSAEPVLRIGGATIDPVSREATSSAGTERLQPQNLKVLIALARREGRVVTRADLIDSCWDGRIVGEDVINHAISVLRVFAARVGGFSIQTVPKAGYRLVAVSNGRGRIAGWRRLAIGFGLAGLLAVGFAFFLEAPAQKQGEPPAPVVALAPFGTPDGDAAAAEVGRAVRVSLSHMLSEAGFPVQLAEGYDDRADYVITGDIDHSPRGFEATVRMEQTLHHTVIFTHRFEAAEQDSSSLPDQIGASVAANLSWTAALMILDRRHPTDPQITSELLKQMSITVEGGDMLRAYEIAREAAQKAPNSAIAQVALAFNTGFALGDLPREERDAAVAAGRKASERARQLAPEFGDVYIPWCVLHSSARRVECEARLRQGSRLDPDAPFTTAFLSTLMSDVGRADEALELARVAIANDPFKPAKLARLIRALAVTGQREEADEVYARAVRWWPTNERVLWGPLLGFIEAGDFAALEQFALQDGSRLASTAGLLAAFRYRDIVGVMRMCRSNVGHPSTQMLCPILLADLGRYDAAFARTDQMYPALVGRTVQEEEKLWLDNPSGYPPSILSAPSAAALRRDPRFIELARRIGLLRYWRTGKLPDFCSKKHERVCSSIAR